jgi:hypothetical protein
MSYIDCQNFFPIGGYGAIGAQLAVPWWAWQAMPLQNEITSGNRYSCVVGFISKRTWY